jgi:hypothetical protein
MFRRHFAIASVDPTSRSPASFTDSPAFAEWAAGLAATKETNQDRRSARDGAPFGALV